MTMLWLVDISASSCFALFWLLVPMNKFNFCYPLSKSLSHSFLLCCQSVRVRFRFSAISVFPFYIFVSILFAIFTQSYHSINVSEFKHQTFICIYGYIEMYRKLCEEQTILIISNEPELKHKICDFCRLFCALPHSPYIINIYNLLWSPLLFRRLIRGNVGAVNRASWIWK